MRYWLLPCTKTKREFAADAIGLYSASIYFCSLLSYFQAVRNDYERRHGHDFPDKAFILSAEHGLIPLSSKKLIEPYEKALRFMSNRERQEWAQWTAEQLVAAAMMEPWGGDFEQSYLVEPVSLPRETVWLTGKMYRAGLEKKMKLLYHEYPQLKFLDNHTTPYHAGGLGEMMGWCREQTLSLGGTFFTPTTLNPKQEDDHGNQRTED